MELETAHFRTTRPGGEGYDKDEVDRFVAEVRLALQHEPPTMAPWEVRDKRFKVGRFHRGYVEHDVDDFLDKAEQALRAAYGGDLTDPAEDAPARRSYLWPATVVLLLLTAAIVAKMVSAWT